jgi:hypothetical protein
VKNNIPEELQICLSCLHNNVPDRDLCENCGAPIGKYTTFLPFEKTLAEGVCYRSAVSNPRNPIILIGIWFLFAPGILSLFYSLFIGWNILLNTWPFPSGFSTAGCFFFYGIISAAILYRTTRNYVKMKKLPQPLSAIEDETPSQ